MNQTVSDYKHETALLSPFSMGRRALARTLPPWWSFLITGIAWMVVSMIVLRFDYTSVYSISLLFGFVALAAGVVEIGMAFLAAGWWKLLNAILAVAFIAAGIVSFIHPGNTFAALAGVFSFFLVFAGAFDIIYGISARRENDAWWLQLVGGIIELALGLWAAGYWGRSAILLVAWVAAFALIRGVRDIVLAFQVREIQHGAADAGTAPARPRAAATS
ncbi:MAG TPA: DUF308 domain-containing protein [Gaiellaceae bacterium]|nr:DUF308 domain-containing protein [Gaiellaceae bacterium]